MRIIDIPATERQLAWLGTLLSERDCTGIAVPDHLEDLARWEASDLIDALKTAPRRHTLAPRTTRTAAVDLSGLKAGRYTTPGGPILVISHGSPRGKWAGATFVRTLDEVKVGMQGASGPYRGERVEELRAIAANPVAAVQLVGLRTGTCGMCATELTNPLSLAAGIGPDCAKRWGIDRKAWEAMAPLEEVADETPVVTQEQLEDADLALHLAAWNRHQDQARLLFAKAVPPVQPGDGSKTVRKMPTSGLAQWAR